MTERASVSHTFYKGQHYTKRKKVLFSQVQQNNQMSQGFNLKRIVLCKCYITVFSTFKSISFIFRDSYFM
uniref:Uncharacterized protein n=1 Tax=Anguilla anguilla TaxID=7936 RepID=A0A0E9WZ32_ANGAN